jgi:hypothetical protein
MVQHVRLLEFFLAASEAGSPSRIFAGHPWHSRVRPCVYRPFDLIIPGTTDAADEVVCHFRHRHALRQFETAGVDVEMTRWPAIAAVDL